MEISRVWFDEAAGILRTETIPPEEFYMTGSEMTATEIMQRRETIRKSAAEKYQTDHRFRALVNSAAHGALMDNGRFDPDHENAEAYASRIATGAVIFALGQAFDDDHELKHTRAERDRFRDMALKTANLTPLNFIIPGPLPTNKDTTDGD